LAAWIVAVRTFSLYNFMDPITSNSPDAGTKITPVEATLFPIPLQNQKERVVVVVTACQI